jgi:hypothetical protein
VVPSLVVPDVVVPAVVIGGDPGPARTMHEQTGACAPSMNGAKP